MRGLGPRRWGMRSFRCPLHRQGALHGHRLAIIEFGLLPEEASESRRRISGYLAERSLISVVFKTLDVALSQLWRPYCRPAIVRQIYINAV